MGFVETSPSPRLGFLRGLSLAITCQVMTT